MPIQSTKTLQKVSATLLILVVFLWVIIAGVRTINNFSKILTEEKSWFGKSDDEKRIRFFGNAYKDVLELADLTKANGTVLIVASDGLPYYLARYHLYPQRVYWSTSLRHEHTHDYIVFIDENAPKHIVGYRNISHNQMQVYEKI